MVLTILILAICIPVTALVTGFFTLKAIQVGLNYKVAPEGRIEVTETAPNTVQTTVQHKENDKESEEESEYKARQMEEAKSLYNEWVYGAKEQQ